MAEPYLVPLGPGVAALGAARAGLPPLFRGLAGPGRRAAATATGETDTRASLNQRLAALNEQGQAQLLLDLVYEETAAALGYDSAADMDRGKEFMELGIDSLTAVELRNRLNAATGLQLPAALVFDTRTPAALASRLHAEFFLRPGLAESTGPEIDSLERMFLDGLQEGKADELMLMVKAVADVRHSFESTAELDELPTAVTMADGPGEIQLICIPAPTANAGPHQYAPLAAHFRGRRKVGGLPLIGFAVGESLPVNKDVAVRAAAE